MSRYITELANDIAKSCPDLVENGCGNDNCVACLAFKLIGLGYQKQEWISVEERLPERLGYYLAHTTRGTIEIARFYPYYVNDKPQFDYWITHWMPLPEAPKMRKEDEGK